MLFLSILVKTLSRWSSKNDAHNFLNCFGIFIATTIFIYSSAFGVASEKFNKLPAQDLAAFHPLCTFADHQSDYDLQPPVQQYTDNDRSVFDDRCRAYQRSVYFFDKMLTLQDKLSQLNYDNSIDGGNLQHIQPMDMDEVCFE